MQPTRCRTCLRGILHHRTLVNPFTKFYYGRSRGVVVVYVARTCEAKCVRLHIHQRAMQRWTWRWIAQSRRPLKRGPAPSLIKLWPDLPCSLLSFTGEHVPCWPISICQSPPATARHVMGRATILTLSSEIKRVRLRMSRP